MGEISVFSTARPRFSRICCRLDLRLRTLAHVAQYLFRDSTSRFRQSGHSLMARCGLTEVTASAGKLLRYCSATLGGTCGNTISSKYGQASQFRSKQGSPSLRKGYMLRSSLNAMPKHESCD